MNSYGGVSGTCCHPLIFKKYFLGFLVNLLLYFEVLRKPTGPAPPPFDLLDVLFLFLSTTSTTTTVATATTAVQYSGTTASTRTYAATTPTTVRRGLYWWLYSNSSRTRSTEEYYVLVQGRSRTTASRVV